MNDTTPSFDEFRRRIPIMELALANGYVLNRSKGMKWPVLEHPDGDRVIIVNPGSPGGQGYFNPGDERDRGTLVAFVLNRLGSVFPRDASLTGYQNVNRILSAWLNIPYAQRLAYRKASAPSRHGTKVSEVSFNPGLLAPLKDMGYLSSRGILPATLEDDAFRNRVMSSCSMGSACVAFPYRQSLDGPIVGAEVRSASMKRHLPGTRKSTGVWVSNPPLVTERLVICESAIDCLSYHQLKGGKGYLYVSFGGSLTQGQSDCISAMVDTLEKAQGFKVLVAVDNDEAGLAYSSRLTEAFRGSLVDKPSKGKDFNEELLMRSSTMRR
jgi:hypothetical protein